MFGRSVVALPSTKKSNYTLRIVLYRSLQGHEGSIIRWHVIKWDVASWQKSRIVCDMEPYLRRPMWQAVSQESDVIVFPPSSVQPLLSLFTPDPVVNSRGKDRWQTDTDQFDASHPSIALCSLPNSKSCQSSQLHKLLFKGKKKKAP